MKKYIFSVIILIFTNAVIAQKADYSISDDFDFENDTIKNKHIKLQEVTINKKTLSKPTLSRSGIKIADLPQAIQIIESEIILQQQAIRLSEVIKNANGVYVGSARGGAQESFWSRGYDMSANNMFKNGFRFTSGSIPEVSSLDKIEILKGSAALLYGNVTPGGVLNMVTKTPNFKTGGEIILQAGSYNFYKPSVDLFGIINKSIAYRVNGTYENSESFRDFVSRKRYYFNPSFLFKITTKTVITLQADYLNDDWTPDFGTGIIGKQLANVSRNTYLGTTWATGNTKQTTASLLVNHDFNANWEANFNTSFQNYDRVSNATERIRPEVNGDLQRPYGRNKNVEQIFANQISLQGNFKTGFIKHQVVTGIDTELSNTDTFIYKFFNSSGTFVNNYDLINIFNPRSYIAANEAMVLPSKETKIIKASTSRYGIYVQDLITFTKKIKALVGVRYSYQEAKPVTYDIILNTKTEEEVRNDRAFSPKIGLIYQPFQNITLFSSYSNSFTPNSGSTIFNEAIKPSIIDQIEAGIKNEFFKGVLTTNLTFYQITNSNLAQTAEFDLSGNININSNVKTLSGETTSKGVELDLIYKPSIALNIIAGYSYNDMRYTKTTGAKGSFIEGDRLTRTPQQTANLSFFYKFQGGMFKDISFGAIANYIGNRLGGYNNQIDSSLPNGIFDREIPLNNYTTVDISAGYDWKTISILCKLSNITNELNYTVHENYSVNPIAPRQVMISLRYKL